MWVLHVEGEEKFAWTTKEYALTESRRYARVRWLKHGELGQLVVHGKDGRIRFEATYGRDPRRYKG
jgi:hypothetical protein